MSIRHGVGDGITDVNGLNRRSTVSDVLDQLSKLLNLDPTKWVIIEVSIQVQFTVNELFRTPPPLLCHAFGGANLLIPTKAL